MKRNLTQVAAALTLGAAAALGAAEAAHAGGLSAAGGDARGLTPGGGHRAIGGPREPAGAASVRPGRRDGRRPVRPRRHEFLSTPPDRQRATRPECWFRPHPNARWRWICPWTVTFEESDHWLYGYVERHEARRDAAASSAPPPPENVIETPRPPDDHPWVTRGETRERGQRGIEFRAPPEK